MTFAQCHAMSVPSVGAATGIGTDLAQGIWEASTIGANPLGTSTKVAFLWDRDFGLRRPVRRSIRRDQRNETDRQQYALRQGNPQIKKLASGGCSVTERPT